MDKDISSFRAIGLSNEVTVAYGNKVISSIYTYCYSRRASIASNSWRVYIKNLILVEVEEDRLYSIYDEFFYNS